MRKVHRLPKLPSLYVVLVKFWKNSRRPQNHSSPVSQYIFLYSNVRSNERVKPTLGRKSAVGVEAKSFHIETTFSVTSEKTAWVPIRDILVMNAPLQRSRCTLSYSVKEIGGKIAQGHRRGSRKDTLSGVGELPTSLSICLGKSLSQQKKKG